MVCGGVTFNSCLLDTPSPFVYAVYAVSADIRVGEDMDPTIRALLENLGVEVDCCPTCEGSSWRLYATSEHGVHDVTCMDCGRTLTGMTRREWLNHCASKFALNLRGTNHHVGAYSDYHLLVDAWLAMTAGDAGGRRLYVTYNGEWHGNDDPPF